MAPRRMKRKPKFVYRPPKKIISLLDLPTELIIKIFNFLPSSDRLMCRLTCKRLASISETFENDFSLHLHHCELSNRSQVVQMLQNSQISFRSLIIEDNVQFNGYDLDDSFWSKLGEQIRSFEIDFDSINYRNGLQIIEHLNMLETFRFSAYSLEDEIYAELFEGLNSSAALSGVKLVSFCDLTFYDNDGKNNEFNELLSKMPNLETLEVEFYEEEITINREAALEFLRTHANKIKCLNFEEGTLVSRNPPIDGLKLEELCFRYNEKYAENCQNFLRSQPNIQKLLIQTRKIPEIIFEHLKTLKLYPTSLENFERFPFLENFTELEELHVIFPRLNPYNANCFFSHDLCMNTSVKSVVFSLRGRNCEICLRSLIRSFPKLRSIILKTANFTAIQIGLLTVLRDLEKISVMNVGEKPELYPIIAKFDLPKLRSLNINGIISGLAFSHFPNLPTLRELSFNYKNTTNAKFEKFLMKCPNVEHLALFSHSSLSDERIISITKRLKHLKDLHLHNCHSLTEKSLQAIGENLKFLKVLELNMVDRTFTTEDIGLLFKNSLRSVHCNDDYITADEVNNGEALDQFIERLDESYFSGSDDSMGYLTSDSSEDDDGQSEHSESTFDENASWEETEEEESIEIAAAMVALGLRTPSVSSLEEDL